MNNNTKEISTKKVEKKVSDRKNGYKKNYKKEIKNDIENKERRDSKIIGSNFIDLGLEGNEEKKVKKSYPKRTNKNKSENRIENKLENKLDFSFKKSNLKIIALGGLDEIGKNITVFEYEDEIVLVDCGLEFPEDDMLGVDLVIPDVTYLIKNKEKNKRLSYNTRSRRPYWSYSLCIKTSKYANICNKTYC